MDHKTRMLAMDCITRMQQELINLEYIQDIINENHLDDFAEDLICTARENTQEAAYILKQKYGVV